MPLIESDLIVGVDDLGHDVKFFGATSGRYMMWDESVDSLEFTDNAKLVLGTGSDFVFFHDGSNSNITNATGNITMTNNADDSDIIFSTDDGSGNTATYLTLDGGVGNTYAYKDIRFVDGVNALFGTGGDVGLKHDGSNMTFINSTGSMAFYQATDDGDMVFYCDDGSGGLTAYITLDGSASTVEIAKNTNFAGAVSLAGGALSISGDGSNAVTFTETGAGLMTIAAPDDIILDAASDIVLDAGGDDIRLKVGGTEFGKFNNASSNMNIFSSIQDKDIVFTGNDGGAAVNALILDMSDAGTATFNHDIKLNDNGRIKLGDAGNDLELYHNGTNSNIENFTGTLQIVQTVDDEDIVFRCDDGSGGHTAYITLDGGNTDVDFHKNAHFLDNVNVKIGSVSGGDLQLYHNGSHSLISNQTGDLFIRNQTNDGDIKFQADDGSGGDAEYFRLDGGLVNTVVLKDFRFEDNIKGTFGSSQDLKLYHDSNNSYIENATGGIYIMARATDADISFQSDDGSGGDAEYFRLDGGLGYMVASKQIRFADGVNLYFGNSNDAQIKHDGSDFSIANDTGNMYLTQNTNDADIILSCDDGSGGTTAYITLDGSQEAVVFGKAPQIPQYITHVGDGNTYFGFADNDVFRVGVGGTTRLNIGGSIELTGNTTVAGDITATDSNLIIGDDGQIGSASATNAMEIADDGVVSFNGGISVAGSIKSTIKTRIGAVTSSTDGDYKMGDVVYFGSTTSMTTGAIYHYKSNGTWELADADSASTCDGLLGIALGAASNTNGVLLRGFVTLDHDPGAVGDVLFVSTTAGDTTATAPSGSGDIVRVIGYCLHASSGMIYFNPDGTFVEVA